MAQIQPGLRDDQLIVSWPPQDARPGSGAGVLTTALDDLSHRPFRTLQPIFTDAGISEGRQVIQMRLNPLIVALAFFGASPDASLQGGATNTAPSKVPVPLTSPLVEDIAIRDNDISYAIGVDIARHFRTMGINVIESEVRQGLSDGLAGDRLRISEKEAKALVIRVQNDNLRRTAAARRNPSGLNQADADRFLEANKTRPGVVSLPSGLQYMVLKNGQGAPVGADRQVLVHFRITYLNGTEFSASEPDKPVAVRAGDAPLKAWAQALPLMQKGAKWRLFVPPHLAYGPAGFGKEIGPNLGLIYDVELVER